MSIARFWSACIAISIRSPEGAPQTPKSGLFHRSFTTASKREARARRILPRSSGEHHVIEATRHDPYPGHPGGRTSCPGRMSSPTGMPRPRRSGWKNAWHRPPTLNASLAQVPEGESRTRGAALGQKAAAGMLALRAQDGITGAESYGPVTTASTYVPTVIPVSSTIGPAHALGDELGRAVPFRAAANARFADLDGRNARTEAEAKRYSGSRTCAAAPSATLRKCRPRPPPSASHEAGVAGIARVAQA